MQIKTYSITIYKKGTPSTPINLEIPACDIGLADLIPAFQQLFDLILETEIKDPGKISCSEGCGACCRQLIPITIPEAFFLDDLLKSCTLEKQTEIAQRFKQLHSLVQAAGLGADLKNPMGNPDLDQRYFDLQADCPFLENQGCIIYQSRPLVCREYLVTSPPEDCADPYHHLLQKLRIKRNLGPMLAAFSARLYLASSVPIPLTLVPSWVEEHQTLAAQKWPGTWLFEKFLQGLIRLNEAEWELVFKKNS